MKQKDQGRYRRHVTKKLKQKKVCPRKDVHGDIAARRPSLGGGEGG